MPARHQALAADLDALHRGVHVARGAAARRLLAQHVPRLERVAHFQQHRPRLQLSGHRAAQLEEGAVRLGRMRKPALLEEGEDVLEVAPHPGRQEEAVVQLLAPAHQGSPVRLLREGGHQRPHQLGLRHHHARMRRHLEGAQLDDALPSVRRAPVEELVDADLRPVRVAGDVHQEVTEELVGAPGRWRRARLVAVEGAGERDLHLVERVVPGLVEARRLRGGSDEEAAEQIRERRMVLDEGEQAREQGRVAHERALQRLGPADGDVVAAAASCLPSVEQVLLRREPDLEGSFEDGLHQRRVLGEAAHRRQVHLENAGVGSNRQLDEAGVARRRIAFQQHRGRGPGAGLVDDGDQP